MKKSGVVLLVAFVCIFFGNNLFSQANERFFKLNMSAAIIANSAFTQVRQPETSGHSRNHEEVKQLGNNVIIKPGAIVGLDLEMGKKEKRKLIFGLALSYTQEEYKYFRTDYLTDTYYTGQIKNTNLDVYEQLLYLNWGFGIKRRLLKKLHMHNAFFIQQKLKVVSRQQGNTTLVDYADYPVGNPYYYQNHYTVQLLSQGGENYAKHDEAVISYRFTLSYELEFKGRKHNIYLFRNFSTTRKYPLPWWGLGISYRLL